MDRTRFSFIAHTEHDICNPVGPEKTDHVIGMLGLGDSDRVVDVGSGKGGWALRVIEKYRCSVTALEPAVLFAAESMKRAVAKGVAGRFELEACRASEYFARDDLRPFDCALCIGSSHAFTNLHGTLRSLRTHVKPGGVIVIGEGYWRKPPAPEYLASFGATEDEMTTHDGNIRLMIDAGLSPLHACTASVDEFDEYEWAYSRGVERFASEHPDDPDRAAMLARSRAWRNSYLRWGRETMGFGLYVLENRAP